MQHELTRGFELGRHVGQAERDGLVFDDRLAEAAALLRIGERNLVGRAGHADGLRGDADAAAFQIGKRDAVALAFGAEPVFPGTLSSSKCISQVSDACWPILFSMRPTQ